MANLKVSLENIIPLTEARDHFSQIVAEVQRDKLYVLTKGGKPAVAIIDVKYLETITGGSINTSHVEKEIQKDPLKVGRTPMISHTQIQSANSKPVQNSNPPANPNPAPPIKISFQPAKPNPAPITPNQPLQTPPPAGSAPLETPTPPTTFNYPKPSTAPQPTVSNTSSEISPASTPPAKPNPAPLSTPVFTPPTPGPAPTNPNPAPFNSNPVTPKTEPAPSVQSDNSGPLANSNTIPKDNNGSMIDVIPTPDASLSSSNTPSSPFNNVPMPENSSGSAQYAGSMAAKEEDGDPDDMPLD